ncbi:MAG: histidinol-phosphate transaminase [Corynebacterium sp.]|nr:histidinol-phosphate transaminase [Corynebacterium sp.]
MFRKDLENIASYHAGKKIPDAIKLSSNESSHPPAPSVHQAMADAAADANRYPDIVASAARERIAAHLGLSASQIAVGTGSSALCQQLVQITSFPGDEVIFPWRSFEAYPIFVNVVGATPVAIPLTADGGNDLDAMAAAITDKTKLIFVCNPNNPTGTYVTKEEFTAFMAKVPANVIVALDEAYFEYVRVTDSVVATEILDDYPNLVGLRTFSKAYGLAGARIGYAFATAPIIDALQKVAIPFSVATAAQQAAIAALDSNEDMVARTEESIAQRDKIADYLGIARSQANFVWIPADHKAGEPTEIEAKLVEHGVIVRAFPEGVRVSITDEQEMDTFIQAWEAAGLPHA